MSTFVRACRAEMLKVTTTKMWWILALVIVGYVGGTAALLGFAFGFTSDEMGMGLLGLSLAPLVYSTATSVGYVFPLLAGSLATTGEFRHETITPTFLALPRRGISLGGKVAVQFGFGGLYGVIAFASTMLLGGGALAIAGVGTGFGDLETWTMVLRGIVAMALWGMIGVGVGALLRNQVAAIIVVIAFTQFVEPILRTLSFLTSWSANVGQFLPGASSDALVGASIYTAMSADVAGTGLDWWQGGLVLMTYAVIATIVGYFVTWRRDIT